MQSEKRSKHTSGPRSLPGIYAVLLLLLGADFFITPHAPVHHLPQVGIYMLVTLLGSGAVMGVAILLRYILRRREDYYER